jgi:plasmid stabilization system protein ParE
MVGAAWQGNPGKGAKLRTSMKRQLILSPRADFDREGHLLYFLRHSPQVVDRFDQAVQAAIKRIGEHPRGCPTLDCSGLPDIELRFTFPAGFKNHLVIYQVTDDSIVILRILHSDQDIEAELRQ